jgi:hypothetical protein
MAAIAQTQAEARAAQRAAIQHAKCPAIGHKPSHTRDQFNKVRAMLGQQAVGIAQIAN